MAKRFFKYKLLLDEHMDDRHAYPMLNERFDVKHVAADLHAGGLPDPRVYELAVTTGRTCPIARVTVKRSTPNTTARASCGTASRRWASSRSAKRSLAQRPAPAARRR